MRILPVTDSNIYRCRHTGQLWRIHGTVEDGYYILFHCDENGNYDPPSDYSEEFAPWEKDHLEIYRKI
ncbi:hypothetical protein NON20_08675 [Synechocystis sp. B12]|nr:hypothetical protein NON20_08675 [Synechocystis sp. B12]